MHIIIQKLVNSHICTKALDTQTIARIPQTGANMTILIVGASGATGRLLVEELLNRGQAVRIVVRALESLPKKVKGHTNLSVLEQSILDMSKTDMVALVRGCHAVVSCLGHSLTLQGIYGRPRRLVTDAVCRLCNAIRENEPTEPIKFILMNTTGNRNQDLDERTSFSQKCVIGLPRLVLPPTSTTKKPLTTCAQKLVRTIRKYNGSLSGLTG